MSDFTWHDVNGDGVGDVGTADTNGDGLTDITAHDTDYDGRVDTYLVDENRDGLVGDRIVADANRDGVLDTNAWDVNGDGVVDHVANESTGWRPVAVPPPQGVFFPDPGPQPQGVTFPQPAAGTIDASGTFQETLVQMLERETDPARRALIVDAIRRQNRHDESNPFIQ